MSLTTKELLTRLQRHYIKPGELMPGGIFVPECGINGGGAGSRVDALHIGFTSTSGRILTGHELKVSRADWLHELNSPAKADQWADQCHAWYLVTATPDIVQPGELPAGWGHMVPGTSKTRMKVLVKAEIHKDHHPSWTTVRSIMSRLDTLQRTRILDERDRHKAEVDDKVRAELDRRSEIGEGLTPDQRLRLNVLGQIEERLGVKIDTWWGSEDQPRCTPDEFAAALKLTRTRAPRANVAYPIRQLKHALKAAKEYERAEAEWAEAIGE